jgi:hypothetical protein
MGLRGTCQCAGVEQEQEEVLEIVLTDVGVHPRAVMIEACDTFVANATVLGPRGPATVNVSQH